MKYLLSAFDENHSDFFDWFNDYPTLRWTLLGTGMLGTRLVFKKFNMCHGGCI